MGDLINGTSSCIDVIDNQYALKFYIILGNKKSLFQIIAAAPGVEFLHWSGIRDSLYNIFIISYAQFLRKFPGKNLRLIIAPLVFLAAVHGNGNDGLYSQGLKLPAQLSCGLFCVKTGVFLPSSVLEAVDGGGDASVFEDGKALCINMRFCGTVFTIFCKFAALSQGLSALKTGGACDVFYLFVAPWMDQPAGDDALPGKFNGRDDLVADGAPSWINKGKGRLLQYI